MKSNILPYDPGVLPTKPAPTNGEVIVFHVEGLPPYKDLSQSIRNRKHKAHDRFLRLRTAAIEAMDGRAWSYEGIALDIIIYGNREVLDKQLIDYTAGVMDTLDGSSGVHFTFLPIAFEDDCQVYDGRTSFIEDEKQGYTVKIRFGGESNLAEALGIKLAE